MTTAADSQQNDWPASWLTLEHGIRSGRYTDPAFARLEHEKLWLHVWQMAARLDEIPQPGDHSTFLRLQTKAMSSLKTGVTIKLAPNCI